MYLAINYLLKNNIIKQNPVKNFVSAVSCGIYKNECLLDFDYEEDSNSDCDVNFVINDKGEIIEVQGTSEGNPFSFSKFEELYKLACKGTSELINIQKQALNIK